MWNTRCSLQGKGWLAKVWSRASCCIRRRPSQWRVEGISFCPLWASLQCTLVWILPAEIQPFCLLLFFDFRVCVLVFHQLCVSLGRVGSLWIAWVGWFDPRPRADPSFVPPPLFQTLFTSTIAQLHNYTVEHLNTRVDCTKEHTNKVYHVLHHFRAQHILGQWSFLTASMS